MHLGLGFRMKKQALLFAVWVLLGCFSSTASALEHIRVQLKWLPQFQFAGYYAAQHLGYYREAGFEVELIPRRKGVHPVDAVLRGDADFGIADSSLLLRRLRGDPVVAIAAIFQHNPLVLATRKADNLLGPLELKNRTVMSSWGVDDAPLTALLYQAGLKEGDVQYVPHSFDPDALIRGDVDALSIYATDQPYYYREQGLDIHLIDPLSYGIDFYGDLLFTSEQRVRRDFESVERFRQATLRGWQYALQQPEQVIQWLINQYGSTSSLGRLQFEAQQTEKMILPKLVAIGHINPSRFYRIGQIYQQLGMVDAEVGLQGFLLQDYMPKPGAVPKWLVILSGLLGLLLVISLSLALFSRQLRLAVAERTTELQQALNDLNRYLRVVDQHVMTCKTDLDGVIQDVSEAYCQVSGYRKEELIGETHRCLRHPEVPDQTYADIWAQIKAGSSWEGELCNLSKSGEAYWIVLHIDPIREADGSISGYSAICEDITDHKRVEALSETDPLTGCYNRLYLDRALMREYRRYLRYHNEFALIMCDIDHFKQVNDQHGHMAGDTALKAVVECLKMRSRAVDIVGRWGGEEFLIICPESSSGDALQLAENLRQAIEALTLDEVGSLTASFGVASIQAGQSTDQLIQTVDKAMYKAKRAGRNRVESILCLSDSSA